MFFTLGALLLSASQLKYDRKGTTYQYHPTAALLKFHLFMCKWAFT